MTIAAAMLLPLITHNADPDVLGGYPQYARLSDGDKRRMSTMVRAAQEPSSNASPKPAAVR